MPHIYEQVHIFPISPLREEETDMTMFINMRHIVNTLKMVKNYFLGLLGHNLIFLDEILTKDGFQ